MAKSQRRSNTEVRKPKTPAQPEPNTSSPSLKGIPPANQPK
jgi:hypothetical protein